MGGRRVNNNNIRKNHTVIWWYSYLNKTKRMGFFITYPLTLIIVCMYKEEGDMEECRAKQKRRAEGKRGRGEAEKRRSAEAQMEEEQGSDVYY